jgi:hypothetical protein
VPRIVIAVEWEPRGDTSDTSDATVGSVVADCADLVRALLASLNANGASVALTREYADA